MSEKFRKKVNAPVKAFGNLRRNIGKENPTSAMGKVAKSAGMTVAGIFQFLLWTVKYTALDNQILRKIEKEFSDITPGKNKQGDDKKFSAFLKKYPNLSSHILYYMFTASVIAGGKVASSEPELNANQNKIETGIDVADIKISHADQYEDFLVQCQPITPYLIGYLANPEGYEADVYKDSRGVWTQGYGSTQKKDGPVGPSSPPMSINEAYETSRWHAEDYETYFIIYCYCCAFDKNMSSNEFLGIASFIYNGGPGMFEPDKSESIKDLGKDQARKNKKDNRLRNDRWWELRKLYRSQGTISRDQVKELFNKYPVKSKGSVFQAWLDGKSPQEIGNNLTNYLRSGRVRAEGLVWRRWLEACLITGAVSPMDLMNCPISGVYEFRQYMKAKGDDLIVGDKMNYSAAVKFKEWVRNPQYWDKKHKKFMTPQNTVLTKSVMPPEIIAKCDQGKCEIIPVKALYTMDSVKIANQKTLALKSDQLVEIGTKYLYDQNYAKAEENYQAAIKADPDNAQAYSDLSILYIKWKKYDAGASIVRQMMLRENTLDSRAGMAGALYNAGICYRKIAEGGINVMENYQSAKISFENAKKLQPKVAVYQKQIDSISKMIEKLQVKKRLSFKSAGEKIGAINGAGNATARPYDINNKSNDRS